MKTEDAGSSIVVATDVGAVFVEVTETTFFVAVTSAAKLTPAEARKAARRLLKAADEAESA